MTILLSVLWLAAAAQIGLWWFRNRRTSLSHALIWGLAAWLGWGLALFWPRATDQELDFLDYLGLCLTGCAAVAVLGARRPHVGAWNLVVFGLLAVMLLPWLEQGFLGVQTLDPLRWFFLGGTIAMGFINYLPTSNGNVVI